MWTKFWSKRLAKLDVDGAKIATRLAVSMLVASLFSLIPAMRGWFDYSFWAAVSGFDVEV